MSDIKDGHDEWCEADWVQEVGRYHPCGCGERARDPYLRPDWTAEDAPAGPEPVAETLPDLPGTDAHPQGPEVSGTLSDPLDGMTLQELKALILAGRKIGWERGPDTYTNGDGS